ncbi:sensor histidine kinase [Gluconobacter morbifer]|uniref:histidine kinase n=1 Tax=Gluconobacter morbifer G707 TaxID=1088869 RepID=G6XJA1_9PROT|nr:ATP-binding protein [Gluconobacter morbifer]EHH68217.1 phosphate regulon sensor protein PhoR [Gluconobacter morbifer G707]
MAAPHDMLLPLTVALGVAALGGWGGLVASVLYRRRSTVRPSDVRTVADLSAPDLRLPIDAFPASVLLVDALGALLHANEDAIAQFGDSMGAILRHPATRAALFAALRAEPATEGDPVPLCSTTLTLDVPVPRTLHLALRRLPGGKGRSRRLLVVLSDRSDAQAVDRMRTEFVAHASHELRTPLASMSGFIDALKDGAGESVQLRTQFLDIMAQQCARMKRLIDRLLYLSRVQAHEHQRPRDLLDVSELMAVVLGEIAPRFEQENRHLRVDVEDGLLIHADEDEMTQVLLNLIENALRYGAGAEDGLTVTLFARRQITADDSWPAENGVLIGVQDNGCGIAPHHLPRLTERFYRVGEARQDGEGTGLGLSIVRHILDRHGGRLKIVSSPGNGATCLVWLPAAGESRNGSDPDHA